MENIIRARKAISKNMLLFGALLLLIIIPIDGIGLQEKGLLFLCILMVIEDFRMQTIDMRLFLLAFLLLMSLSGDYITFLYLFVWGMLLFRLLFLLTTRIKKDHFNELPGKLESIKKPLRDERLSFGYLPSLCVSWMIYQAFIMKIDVPLWLRPTHEGILIFKDFFTIGIFAAALMACICAIWILFEFRLQRAILARKDINYGFGDGDVFVLAAMFAFLGFETLMTIFFISLIVQVICYLIFYLRDEVNFLHYGK